MHDLGLDDLPGASRMRRVGRVGIVGDGRMGQCLATALVEADIPVTVFDQRGEALQQAMAAMRANYRECAEEGGLSGYLRDRRIGFLAGSSEIHHLKDCDVIIDTTSVPIKEREELFRELDGQPTAADVDTGTMDFDDADPRIQRR